MSGNYKFPCVLIPIFDFILCCNPVRFQIKYSHLDISGRPVVVLEKNNVVPDHNQHIQVI